MLGARPSPGQHRPTIGQPQRSATLRAEPVKVLRGLVEGVASPWKASRGTLVHDGSPLSWRIIKNKKLPPCQTSATSMAVCWQNISQTWLTSMSLVTKMRMGVAGMAGCFGL